MSSLVTSGDIPFQDDAILVENLSKTYLVPEREAGFGAAVRSFFRRQYRNVEAAKDVSFRIGAGEIVGFLGPNGAGKTTTLKMLAGVLHPTRGTARVLGYTPWERKREYLLAMTLVMGQRSRLSWDIPAADSFQLGQAIYRLSDEGYKADAGGAGRAAGPVSHHAQAGAQPLAGGAYEVRAGCGPAAPAARALSR